MNPLILFRFAAVVAGAAGAVVAVLLINQSDSMSCTEPSTSTFHNTDNHESEENYESESDDDESDEDYESESDDDESDEELRFSSKLNIKELTKRIERMLPKYDLYMLTDSDGAFSTMAAIDVGELINYDVLKQLRDPEFFRLLAHLKRVSGQVTFPAKSKDIEIKLEGWDIDKFLPLSIYCLFKQFVQTKCWQDDGTLSACYANQMILKIKKEMVVQIEALRVYRNNKAIKKCSDELSSSLFSKSAKDILTQIQNLSIGEEYCCATGYKKHAMYVCFTKINAKDIYIRIDNLGAGVEKGVSDTKGKTVEQYQPCLLAKISVSEVKKGFPGLEKYLRFLCQANWGEEEALDKIYYPDFLYEKGKKKSAYNPGVNFFPYKPQQTVGNCVVENFLTGMDIRVCYNAKSKKYEFPTNSTYDEEIIARNSINEKFISNYHKFLLGIESDSNAIKMQTRTTETCTTSRVKGNKSIFFHEANGQQRKRKAESDHNASLEKSFKRGKYD